MYVVYHQPPPLYRIRQYTSCTCWADESLKNVIGMYAEKRYCFIADTFEGPSHLHIWQIKRRQRLYIVFWIILSFIKLISCIGYSMINLESPREPSVRTIYKTYTFAEAFQYDCKRCFRWNRTLKMNRIFF